MRDLPITNEARLLYRASCKKQEDYVKVQQDKGVNLPQSVFGS